MIATLLYLRKMQAFPLKKGRRETRGEAPQCSACGRGQGRRAVGKVLRPAQPPLCCSLLLALVVLPAASVPQWFKDATAPFVTAKGGAPSAPEGSLEARLKAGNYGVIRSLMRALERVG